MLRKFSRLFRALICLFTFVLVFMFLAMYMLETNRIMVDQNLGTYSNITITVNDGNLFTSFVPDDDYLTNGKLDPDKTDKVHNDLQNWMTDEGIVLLKNENNALPITGEGKKVTVLGRRNFQTVGPYSSVLIPFIDGIEAGGFAVNDVAKKAYLPETDADKNGEADLPALMNPPMARNKEYQKFDAREGSDTWLKNRQPGLVDSFKNFSDAAIVTLGRNGAEGPDYQASVNGVPVGSGAKNPMDLFDSERSLIKLATDNFDKVIVLIDGVNMMEIGELKDDPKIDAIMWIGTPGSGANALGRILKGEVNPSGGLYATYARDSLAAPALKNTGSFYFKNWMDFGEGIAYSGGKNNSDDWGKFMRGPNYPGAPNGGGTGLYGDYPEIKVSDKKGGRVDTGNPGTNGTDAGLETYLMEVENIYTGYRYFETRYYDCVMGNTGAKSEVGKAWNGITNTARYTGGWDYAKEMAYDFGFGLSYTTFQFTMGEPVFEDNSFTVSGRPVRERIATVPVTVKNTGSVPGKTPVQIYAQSPYTAYDKTNAVEKSAIQLVAFDKTKVLAAGGEQTLNIRVDLQELASYDYKGAKTFMMDASDDYYFSVGNGVHDALNNILAAQGKTIADGMTKNGRKEAAKKWSHQHPTDSSAMIDDLTFSWSKSGVKITNQLQYSHLDDYNEMKGIVKELTRNDWSGTFPKSYESFTIEAKGLLVDHYNGKYYEIKTTDATDSVVWGKDNNLKFGDMKGAAFDDYRWELLLEQLTIEEAIQGTIQGGRGFANMPSIGYPTGSYSENGPGTPVWYQSNSPNEQPPWRIEDPGRYGRGSGQVTYGGTNPPQATVASTFNREISKEWGRISGNDSIFAEKPILWMPASNTFRHGYNGRMYIYYSEDPILTGVHTMEMAVEARKKGAIICAKHIAFNDQEMHRYGVGAFMTEQRAREIDLRAFQIAFESNIYDQFDESGEKIVDVGMMGAMTSFAKLGGIECTVNKGMLTGIMRREWGFNGYVVSDLKDDLDLMRQGAKAGMTGWDWRAAPDDIDPWAKTEDWAHDTELMLAMKECIKRDMWVFANSNFMNNVNASSTSHWNMTWWRAAYISGFIVSGVFIVAATALYVVSIVLRKKKEGN